MGQLKIYLEEAYEPANGNHAFGDMIVKGPAQIITVLMANIVAANNKLKLQQSADGSNYDDIADSEVTIAAAQTSQSWNLYGLPRGASVRVYLTAGTNETGTIEQIKMLTDE
jgi:hypothetical protein